MKEVVPFVRGAEASFGIAPVHGDFENEVAVALVVRELRGEVVCEETLRKIGLNPRQFPLNERAKTQSLHEGIGREVRKNGKFRRSVGDHDLGSLDVGVVKPGARKSGKERRKLRRTLYVEKEGGRKGRVAGEKIARRPFRLPLFGVDVEVDSVHVGEGLGKERGRARGAGPRQKNQGAAIGFSGFLMRGFKRRLEPAKRSFLPARRPQTRTAHVRVGGGIGREVFRKDEIDGVNVLSGFVRLNRRIVLLLLRDVGAVQILSHGFPSFVSS